MRLSEVRLIRGARKDESNRYQLAIGQGVTFVCGEPDDAGNDPFSDLHLNLILGESTDSKLLSQQIPSFDDVELFSQCQSPADHWEFLFSGRNREYHLSSEKSTRGQVDFFSQTIIGDEGSQLGHQLDLPLLADRYAPDTLKRESIEELREKLNRLRLALYDESTGSGKLASMTTDYERCRHDLEVLSRSIVSGDQLVSLMASEEKSLADLKKEDDVLAREQRLTTLLERKSEYETLLELRRELKEIEEREGRYGSRITEMGHDITVHELMALVQWRGNAADINGNLAELQNVARQRREQKVRLEQERILLTRRIRNSQESKDNLLDKYEQFALTSDVDHDNLFRSDKTVEQKTKTRTFPTSFHFCVLASLLAMAIGLIFLAVDKTAGVIFLVLAGLGLVATFMPRIFKGLKGSKEATGEVIRPDKEELRSKISDLDHRLVHDREKLDEMDAIIGELEREMTQGAIEIETTERQLNRLNNDLLRTIKKYAGPCELHEVDDVIEALSKQRESSADRNEAIADLLRRIADLKHGRSDAEMLREYESVCEQLYGGDRFDTTNGDSQRSRMKTMQLHYDPMRAKQISEERVEIARQIDEKKALIKETKDRLALSKESSVKVAGLNNRFAMLENSIAEMKNDFSRLNKSIAWLDRVLESWHEKEDIMTVMAKAVRYVGRMSGRRTGETFSMTSVDKPPVHKIRSPALLEQSISSHVSPISLDPNAFNQTTAEQNYLALRLAWATQCLSGMPEGSPIFLMAPTIPHEYSQMVELVNTLEEWALETGRQAVFFTTDSYIIDIALSRNLVVHRIR
ncbi:MAG: hypothetical protein GX991_01755 [Clostridiaceae bacterium]|nr:hypothetical protein [Clostridiaceae bacterium]